MWGVARVCSPVSSSRVSARPRVSAVDPSAPFVAAARERYPAVDVQRAPAERLPYAAGTFDAALAQLVVHFMADPTAGLAEMRRVTRPGGVVAACVWDHAGGRGPLSVFWKAARTLDPTVEDESRRAGSSEGSLEELLASAGLRNVEGAVLSVRFEHSSLRTGGSRTRPASGREPPSYPASIQGSSSACGRAAAPCCPSRLSWSRFTRGQPAGTWSDVCRGSVDELTWKERDREW